MVGSAEVVGVVVNRGFSVRAPMPLVLTGVRVIDHDPPVSVSVSDEDFVRVRIDPDTCGTPEEIRIIAAAGLVVLPDLHEQLAIASELHDPMMAIGANPDVVIVVDEETVGVSGELRYVLGGRVSPALDDVPILVELYNDRRGPAAQTHRRILHR